MRLSENRRLWPPPPLDWGASWLLDGDRLRTECIVLETSEEARVGDVGGFEEDMGEFGETGAAPDSEMTSGTAAIESRLGCCALHGRVRSRHSIHLKMRIRGEVCVGGGTLLASVLAQRDRVDAR